MLELPGTGAAGIVDTAAAWLEVVTCRRVKVEREEELPTYGLGGRPR